MQVTIEGLKNLSLREQEQMYGMFWFSSFAAEEGTPQKQKYEDYLRQLEKIFELDAETARQWAANAASVYAEVELLLQEVA